MEKNPPKKAKEKDLPNLPLKKEEQNRGLQKFSLSKNHLNIMAITLAIIIVILWSWQWVGAVYYQFFPRAVDKTLASEISVEKKSIDKLLGYLNGKGQDPNAVKVISSQRVDWPDSSLGAPEEGRFYSSVITPGYRVTLDVQGTSYEVHTNLGLTEAFLVKDGRKIA